MESSKKPKVSWLAKLTPAQVKKIRELRALGWDQKKLAARFNVSQPAICNLLRGRTYRNA